MNMKKYLFLLAFPLLISSCEGFNHVEGIVADEKTQQPIIGAILLFKNDTLLTDSLGRFEVYQRTLIFNSKIHLTIKKSGYKTTKKSYRGWNDTPVTILMKSSDE